MKNKNLIVFTVGLGKTDDISVFEPIKKHNFTDTMIENIKFFHLRGGIDYKKLSFMHKLMMSMMKKMIEKKSEKNAEDEQFVKTYGQSVVFTDKSIVYLRIMYAIRSYYARQVTEPVIMRKSMSWDIKS